MVPTFLPSSSTTRHKPYNGYHVHSSICLSNNPPFKQFASDFSTKFSLLSLFLFLQFQRLSNIHLIFLDIYFLGLLLWTRLLIYFLVFFFLFSFLLIFFLFMPLRFWIPPPVAFFAATATIQTIARFYRQLAPSPLTS